MTKHHGPDHLALNSSALESILDFRDVTIGNTAERWREI
jgi:hypothetical protein